MASIDDNITQLFDFANRAMTNARAAEGRISSLIPSVSGASLNYQLEKPNMAAPISMGDLLPPGNSEATIQFLDAKGEAWIDQYFPEINACLRSSPEEWLCGIITGQKPFGLSKEVFEAVWHESRDREYRARNSAVRQLNAEFSSRGFSVPIGAHIAALANLEDQASIAVGDVNRAQTVKNAEIKLDLLKFAEEQAIRLKLGVMQAMATFYQQWVELPNRELEANRLRAQNYATFQGALSDYYRVQLGFENLRLQAESLRMNGKLDVSRIKVDAASGDTRNSALGQAVQAYGNISSGAASAAATLNAEIGTPSS